MPASSIGGLPLFATGSFDDRLKMFPFSRGNFSFGSPGLQSRFDFLHIVAPLTRTGGSKKLDVPKIVERHRRRPTPIEIEKARENRSRHGDEEDRPYVPIAR